MSTREYWYNRNTEQYAVTLATNPLNTDDLTMFTVGEMDNPNGGVFLDDPDEWLQITSENADLFLDDIVVEKNAVKARLETLNSIELMLEGIF